MNEINDAVVNIRKCFAFLWDEYGFKFVELVPKIRYPDSGYFVQLENEWCKVVFQSENGYLDDVINDFDISPPKKWMDIKYTAKEILDLATMLDIPYQLIENSWIRVDLINDID